MKNIEKLIKDSLENHELPYNAAVWDSISKRLDGTPPTPFYRKWWVAASIGTALVSTAVFFAYLNNSSNTHKEHKTVHSNVELTDANDTKTVNSTNKQTYKKDIANKSNLVKSVSVNPETTPEISQNTSSQKENNPNTPLTVNNEKVKTGVQHPEIKQKNTASNSDDTRNLNVAPPNYTIPLKKNLYCVGDEIAIENPNDTKMLVAFNGQKEFVAASSKKNLIATNEGTIELSIGDKKEQIRIVKAASNLFIDVDPTLIYNDGIPSIEFTATGVENGIQWNVKNHPSEQRNGKLIVHPYSGQTVVVTAITKDENGCFDHEEKTIVLNERYNLQAATGFRPNSGDSRTNTFMPYSLKERNVSFELTIYDAKSGLELFRSTDSSIGWDGKTKSGDELKVGTTALWKVILHNPNPGEPSEYKGQITITE